MSRLILLIEDGGGDWGNLSRYLEFVGARVVHGTEDEAARLVHEHQPDLMLLSVDPETEGAWVLMERLQLDPRTSSFPVVVLTTGEIPAERADSLGICGQLLKPVTPFQLLEEIERCLGSLHPSESSSYQERAR